MKKGNMKAKKPKKSKIEKQYEKYFSFFGCNPFKMNPMIEPPNNPNLQTWVTYGAFEDPII